MRRNNPWMLLAVAIMATAVGGGAALLVMGLFERVALALASVGAA